MKTDSVHATLWIYFKTITRMLHQNHVTSSGLAVHPGIMRETGATDEQAVATGAGR